MGSKREEAGGLTTEPSAQFSNLEPHDPTRTRTSGFRTPQAATLGPQVQEDSKCKHSLARGCVNMPKIRSCKPKH